MVVLYPLILPLRLASRFRFEIALTCLPGDHQHARAALKNPKVKLYLMRADKKVRCGLIGSSCEDLLQSTEVTYSRFQVPDLAATGGKALSGLPVV